MKIGILADTHDQVHNIMKAVEIFNNEGVDFIYHAGDICSPFVLDVLKSLNCTVKIVFGNNDGDIFKHMHFKPENIEFLGRFHVDDINGRTICIIHGDPVNLAEQLFESRKYDVLIRAHNHVSELRRNEKTLMINPGNLIGPFNETTAFWTRPSVAIYDSESNDARLIEIE